MCRRERAHSAVAVLGFLPHKRSTAAFSPCGILQVASVVAASLACVIAFLKIQGCSGGGRYTLHKKCQHGCAFIPSRGGVGNHE